MDCMGALELFLHDQPEPTPVLLKAALAHVQFETIHPFLDGNGRLGRLLITLLLCEQKALRQPMLCLSLFFKTHRQACYDLLNRVRTEGDWEAWLDFFAEAVTVAAGQAVDTAQRLGAMACEDRAKAAGLRRPSGSVLRLHHELLSQPITTAKVLAEKTGMTPMTVTLSHLCRLGIATELTGHKRNRVYSYPAYINILNEGTELPGK